MITNSSHQMWPTVHRAIEFVLALQTRRGEIVWERTADGAPAEFALLAGCSSYFPAERSSWTAAAMILTADVLSGTTGGSGLFKEAGADEPIICPAEPSACGCAVITTG